jgi:predicted Zn finger-like uncharacterized protein
MKIVCEACQAKYSISDEKVRGKAFKIRCKKCSHIIVVRASDAGSGASPLPIGDSGMVPVASASDHSWHIVVDGEQVGPLSASDVRARRARGEITGDTYIWREGMADWLKMSAVTEFSESGQALDDASSPFPPQPSGYPPGTAEGAFASSGDPFGAKTTVGSAMSADLFASPSAAPEPSAAPASPSFAFGSNAGAAHSEGGSGLRSNGSGSLTGQRHENSVLFSLSNLEALAGPPAAASSGPLRPGSTGPTEGSGLIDIRSMAAMTLGNAAESRPSSDLPTFGAPQFSPVAPVLLPLAPSSGPPRWLYAVLAVLVLLGGSMGIVMYRLVASRPPPPVVGPAVAVAPPTPPAVTPPPPRTTAPPTTPPPSATEPLPPRDEKAAAAPSGPRPAHTGHVSRRAARVAAAEAAGGDRAAAPAAAAPVEKPAPKGDKLDDLLNSALGNKPRPAAAPTARARDEEEPARKPAAATLGKLGREDMVRGMQGVTARVHDCFNQYKVPGTAMVHVNVARGGKVSGATVGGKFAGTPTGSCIESAARGAHFPPVEQDSFDFPFQLH